MHVSYLEIYCESVRDLMGKDQEKSLQVPNLLYSIVCFRIILYRIVYLILIKSSYYVIWYTYIPTLLQVKEKADVGVYVKDLTTVVVKNADDMDKIMNTGNSHRMTLLCIGICMQDLYL